MLGKKAGSMSRLKPMIIVMLMLTSALAGCVDRDNNPDHHDNEPGLHHHGDENYHQHDENDETNHAESDRHHCHYDNNEPTSDCS